MNRYVELLSGAGDFESAKAAIAGGCDAIYIGMKNYGARRMAANFDDSDLDRVARLARRNRKKIYLTVNTVIKDAEVKDFIDTVRRALSAGVDALIMQDWGMIELVKGAFEGVRVHASTQANMHNAASVERAARLGVERVILSRECELAEIEALCAKKAADIETFVYGALCSAVSGVCYMSSLNNNRSGNRGVCTQMCRLKYECRDGASKFFLSTKDLCALPYLRKLYDAGVASFKIEGRNRSEAYVYNVTSVFREAIDLIYAGKYDAAAAARLADRASMTYNRRLTSGYLGGRSQADIIFCERNANNGLLVSDRVLEFNPAQNLIKATFKTGFNKSDLLEFENDAFERVSVKIESIKTDGGKVVFDAPARASVALTFRRIKKEGEQGPADLDRFLPRKIFLTHSQAASSIKSIKSPDAVSGASAASGPAAPGASGSAASGRPSSVPASAAVHDPSKRPIEAEVDVGASGIVCDIYCMAERFHYKLDGVEVHKAEKQPLAAATVLKTFMAYDRDRFSLAESGFECRVQDGIFIPLSLLKKYGKTVFEKFEKDFAAFEAKKAAELTGSLEVVKTRGPLPVEEIKPASASFRLMLFDDGAGAGIRSSLDAGFDEVSLHYYYLAWLYDQCRLEDFFEANHAVFGRALVELPPVLFQGRERQFVKLADACMDAGFKGFIANNAGQIELLKRSSRFARSGARLVAGAALNIVNRYTAAHFDRLDSAAEICLSYELNDSDMTGLLEYTLNSKPHLIDKFRIRLYGNINVANFAYDFFKQNEKYFRARYAGSAEKQYKFDRLSFKNAVHYMLSTGSETTLAYSGGILNLCPFLCKYMTYGVNKYDISLFNYSEHFTKDVTEISEYIKGVRSGYFSDKVIEGRGIVKDMTLV